MLLPLVVTVAPPSSWMAHCRPRGRLSGADSARDPHNADGSISCGTCFCEQGLRIRNSPRASPLLGRRNAAVLPITEKRARLPASSDGGLAPLPLPTAAAVASSRESMMMACCSVWVKAERDTHGLSSATTESGVTYHEQEAAALIVAAATRGRRQQH